MKNVLVVAAHPDDELLGCGGTVARHVAEGDDVSVLIMAEGATAREEKRPETSREAEALFEVSKAVAELQGIRPPTLGRLHDNRMDTYPFLDLVKVVERVARDCSPEIVYTHCGGDLNIDHQLTHRAVLTALRPLPGATTAAIYSFETLSSTEWLPHEQLPPFHPNHFVEISPFLDRKVEALRLYESEMRPHPHPRSEEAVRSLAALRGSAVGVAAAEAFQVVRQIARLI